MKASELITQLMSLIAVHGDLQVAHLDGEYGCWNAIHNTGTTTADRANHWQDDDLLDGLVFALGDKYYDQEL